MFAAQKGLPSDFFVLLLVSLLFHCICSFSYTRSWILVHTIYSHNSSSLLCGYIFFHDPVCAMCLLLPIVRINLCKRISKNIDERIQTKLISIEEFPVFPTVLICVSTLNYTDIFTDKLLFLTSSCFVFWYPVKQFPNVMSKLGVSSLYLFKSTYFEILL